MDLPAGVAPERLEGVGSAFAASRDGIDVLLRDRGLRRTTPDLTAESLLLGAHASAVLEGSDSSVAQARSGGGDAVTQAALRVSVELLGLVPVFSRSPLQALARLHTLAGAGDTPTDELGRPRDASAALRLRGVAALLGADRPALVTAALVHAELATGRCFASYDGLVARAAERLVLVSTGVDPTSLVVPEAGHLALRPSYDAALAGYASSPDGVRTWLLHCARAYTAGAEASPAQSG